jgi:predicted DNA-binding protein (MmcQ/YjbR family)
VFKVAGRVFLIVTEDPDEQIVTVKAEGPRAEALIREHESIQHGRYLDKRHWLSVGAGGAVTTSLVRELVHDSYDLVRAQLSAPVRGQLGGDPAP